jgi:hypothetical protein
LIRNRLISRVPLVDERVAVIAEQPDLDSVLVQERGREPLNAVSKHRAGDRSRVDLIGLPRLAFAVAWDTHQLRGHMQHSLTG